MTWAIARSAENTAVGCGVGDGSGVADGVTVTVCVTVGVAVDVAMTAGRKVGIAGLAGGDVGAGVAASVGTARTGGRGMSGPAAGSRSQAASGKTRLPASSNHATGHCHSLDQSLLRSGPSQPRDVDDPKGAFL